MEKDVEHKIHKIKDLEDGVKYKIEIKVPTNLGWIDDVYFIVGNQYHYQYIPMTYKCKDKDWAYFETDIDLNTKAIYHYFFSYTANHQLMYHKNNNKKEYPTVIHDDTWKLSVNFDVPKWAEGKVMYHIFVDRFCKGRTEALPEMKNRTIHNWDEDVLVGPDDNGIWNADFYGGDIEGIINNLDYIESLGVSILYLSPIVWSQSNHRYDTSDYEKVDPYAGTNLDLKRLCEKAHQKNMKVILDAVFNHTGNDSKYFNQFGNFDELGAYQSKDSNYFPFFRKYYDNNRVFFDYWWGMTNLPVCDGNSSEWQNYIYGEGGIIDLWFDLGIDGLRLDVADELSDQFIEGIRGAVKRNKEDGFILGEVWKNPMRMNRGYIESGKGMDSVMNYPLIDALIRYYKYEDVPKLREVIRQLMVEYPDDTLFSLMNFTSTHDITRAINIFGTKEFQYSGEWAWNLYNNDRDWQKKYQMSEEEYQRGKEIYKSYLYSLAFLPGNLSIFYGDEAGIQGMGNLANRRPYPWKREDVELIRYFQEIGKIRKQESFLENAGLDIVDINNKYMQFVRSGEKEEALVTVSRTKDESDIVIPNCFDQCDLLYPLGNYKDNKLSSYGGFVLKKRKK